MIVSKRDFEMDCSTIIVSYNTFDLTERAIRSALAAAEGLEHEVIVVDNNSPDDSATRLQESFPKDAFPTVTITANAGNVGFARANNEGAALARGKVLFFLNPDTIVHDRAIRILHDFVTSRPDVGAAGPHVLNEDGTDQPSTFPFVTPGYLIWHRLPVDALFRGSDRRDDYVPAQTEAVDIIKGCALAIHHEVFEEISGWNESYFMYNEERELCHALANAGYSSYFVREAKITHLGGASSIDNYAEQQIVHQKSLLQFMINHRQRGLVVLNRVTGALGFGARAVIFRMLARLRPRLAEDYVRRGLAASALFRWFVVDYSP